MENNYLENLWNNQGKNSPIFNAKEIVEKAKNQRKNQKISTVIMTVTAIVLLLFTAYVFPSKWNNFAIGLMLMTCSLIFRIVLEIIFTYKKKNKLVAMDNNSFYSYLKSYYKARLLINYVITPICISLYIYGFYLLLPYFKAEFSEGFYTYILVSGIGSLVVIIGIIINSILKEKRFLKNLKGR